MSEYDYNACGDCNEGFHCNGIGAFNFCCCFCVEIYQDELDEDEYDD